MEELGIFFSLWIHIYPDTYFTRKKNSPIQSFVFFSLAIARADECLGCVWQLLEKGTGIGGRS
jgi:hypothetical protein